MKPFTWENYDGRKVVLCGPLYSSLLVLPSFLGHEEVPLYLCDDEFAGMSMEQILNQFESEVRTSYASLRSLRLTVISMEELTEFAGEYVILTGKAFFRMYCKRLSYRRIEDFYSACPILKHGYEKGAYFSYFSALYKKRKEGVYLGGVEVVLTKRCSLRCKECANLMQYYDQPEKLNRENVLKSVQRLLQAVDGIAFFKLLGGEPLLEQELIIDILKLPEVASMKKILGIQIISNGTILFKNELLETLAELPITEVFLSNYEGYSIKEAEIRKQLDDYGIAYCEMTEDMTWTAYGDPRKFYHTIEEADALYRTCSAKDNCCTLLDGELYHCPRDAHGVSLGYYRKHESVVDLLHNTECSSVREQMLRFLEVQGGLDACRRCRNLTGPEIARAEQK